MSVPIGNPETGMELRDLLDDSDFCTRRKAHLRPSDREALALRRLARAFAESPEHVLQELVDVAMESCGAESAGISLEEFGEGDAPRFRWAAVAGSFAPYLNGLVPRFHSPCGTCLDSGRPQLYRVTRPYYDFLGLQAKPITDGILIPWRCEGLKGTLWAVSHESREAFDFNDFTLLSSLADFASVALRYKQQQEALRVKERESASALRSNQMAHQINNPLQILTNIIFLGCQASDYRSAREYLDQAARELEHLSGLVSRQLGMSG